MGRERGRGIEEAGKEERKTRVGRESRKTVVFVLFGASRVHETIVFQTSGASEVHLGL